MLNKNDFLEATRRFKDKKTKPHERLRYHALLLVSKGYSYRDTADILFVDEQTVSKWVGLYQLQGLDGLKNNPRWGGEHNQRRLNSQQLTHLLELLETEAMPGTLAGSGWTVKAIRDLIEERFAVSYSRRGVIKLLHKIGWSYQRGRKLYIKRSREEQSRFEAETLEILDEFARGGAPIVPLAGDQTKVYLEATIAKRWNPSGLQPLIADQARSKHAESIYGAIHLGTGEEVATMSIDWQDTQATLEWFLMILRENPRATIVLWIDRAPHQVNDEIEEFLEEHPRLRVIHFPAYTPEENPKEGTWKKLKEEVSHHCWHETKEELSLAIDRYYQKARRHVVNFFEKFGYYWSGGRIYLLPELQ